MKFAAATTVFTIVLGACSTAPAPAPSPAAPTVQEVYGPWVIEQARSAPIIDKRRARLVLGRDGRLTGHTSCNAMNASFTLQGTRLAIGPVATTRMACGELYREQEDRILTALELAASARVRDDGLLEIRDAEGRGLLRATRAAD